MGDSYQNFSFLREYRTASTLDEKISILLNARREQSAGVYGLATRLLVEHLKASAGQDSGIRAEEIERVYPLRRSLDGGFIIEPDWVYRDAMAEVAEQHQIPWLDFVQYTMQFDEIKISVLQSSSRMTLPTSMNWGIPCSPTPRTNPATDNS